MKLKPKPTVVQRLHLLTSYSSDFMQKLGGYTDKLNEEFPYLLTRSESPSDECLQRVTEYAEQLCKDFCIAWKEQEMRYALIILNDFVLNGGASSKKVGFRFQDDELHIVFRAPMTKRQLTDMWDVIDQLQERFIEGYGSKESKEQAEYAKRVNEAKLRIGKMPIKEYRSLRNKEKELYKQEPPETLPIEDMMRLAELQALIDRKGLFTENPKEQLDEDVLILRLFRDHGEKAEDEYHLLKLNEWLNETQGVTAEDGISFAEACAKHCPEFMDSTDIYKVIRAKNFEQRLAQAREAFCLV